MDRRTQRLARCWQQAVLRDLISMALVCIAVYIVTLRVNVFEAIAAFVQRNERLQLDEAFSVLLTLPVLLSVFAWRRWWELRRTKDGLQRSEAQYRRIVETAQEGVWTLDAQQRTTFVNAKMAAMLGCTADAMLGQPVFAFMDDAAQHAAAASLELRRQGVVEQLEFTFRRTDGTPLLTLLTANPLVDDAGHYVGALAMVSDITAWRQAELGRAELAAIVESSEDAILGKTLDGTITSWNAGAEHLYGYTAAEAIGQSVSLLLPPGQSEELPALLQQLALGTPAHHCETQRRSKSGALLDVSLSLSPIRGTDGGVRGISAVARNITERKRAEETLRDSEASFRLLFADNPHPMWVYDLETLAFLEVNDAAVEHYGYGRAEFLTMRITDIRPEAAIPPLLASVHQPRPALQRSGKWQHRLKDGRLIEVEISSHRVPFTGRPGVLVVAQDITERLQLAAQLKQQAFTDALTGLPNRALYKDRLTHAVTRTRRQRLSLAVLFLDLDRFKLVNDSLGHATGDELLVAVATRLRTMVRASDTVARLGGDEFSVLLEDLTGPEDARQVADALVVAFQQPFVVGEHELYVTVSVGGAYTSEPTASTKDLLRHADVALYAAKAGGRSRAMLYDPAMDANAAEQLQLETDLRRAVEHGELVLYYQPVVALDTGQVTGVEALVRWQHPQQGLLAPSAFIPLAEETGLILPIGAWVLREACRQAAAWRAQWPERPALVMSVNLSVRQLEAPGLVEQVASVLAETKLPAELLRLEVTETTVMQRVEEVIPLLQALKGLGVQLAVDDFGTGYSSLSYLARLPVDVLKVDQSFVRNLGTDSGAGVIVHATVALAHALHMEVTAEGIELAEQAARLRRQHCDHGQGYYFARPMPAAAVAGYLLQAPEQHAQHKVSA